MMALNPDQFDLRPGFTPTNKPNPGPRQGTLFRAPASMRTQASRQPRGYSPERMAAVQSRTQSMYNAGQDIPLSITRQSPSGGVIEKDVGHSSQFAAAQLRQNLARSTVPATAMNPDTVYHLNDPTLAARHAHAQQSGAAETEFGKPLIQVAPGMENAPEVIHELGHGFSEMRNTPHYAYNNAIKRGREEGFAENFEQRHSRSPGYKPRTQPGEDRDSAYITAGAWARNEGTRREQRNFRSSYAEERNRVPENARMTREWENLNTQQFLPGMDMM